MKLTVSMVVALLICAAPAFSANWYSHEDAAKALELAKKTGRPIVAIYHDPNSLDVALNKMVKDWETNKGFEAYIGILVNANKDVSFMGKALEPMNEVPSVFIFSYDFETIERIKSKNGMADPIGTKIIAESIAKKLGPFLSNEKADLIWSKLDEARKKLGEQGKASAAMKIYADLNKIEKVFPRNAIVREIKADTEAINAKGRELIEQAKKMNDDGKKQDAITFLRQLADAFRGYDAGKEAVEAGKQIAAGAAAPAPADKEQE